MLNPTNLTNGAEQYEKYRCGITKKTRYQYDYRATDGELFSCTKLSLEDCRAARDKWLTNKTLDEIAGSRSTIYTKGV